MDSGERGVETFTVRRADWAVDQAALRAVRETVFVREQHVPPDLEWDEHDAVSVHVLAVAPDGRAIGTGRLLPDGHIGRMAVLRDCRGRGVGTALLRELIGLAAQAGMRELVLHAQTHAVAFYQRFGFVTDSEPFMDAGIAHCTMRRKL